jgi:hypothetical protein
MNTALSPVSHSQTAPSRSRYWLRPLGIWLAFGGLLPAFFSVQAINHAPIVSWIPDQKVTSSTPGFQTQYFRIISFDGAIAGAFTLPSKATPAVTKAGMQETAQAAH